MNIQALDSPEERDSSTNSDLDGSLVIPTIPQRAWVPFATRAVLRPVVRRSVLDRYFNIEQNKIASSTPANKPRYSCLESKSMLDLSAIVKNGSPKKVIQAEKNHPYEVQKSAKEIKSPCQAKLCNEIPSAPTKRARTSSGDSSNDQFYIPRKKYWTTSSIHNFTDTSDSENLILKSKKKKKSAVACVTRPTSKVRNWRYTNHQNSPARSTTSKVQKVTDTGTQVTPRPISASREIAFGYYADINGADSVTTFSTSSLDSEIRRERNKKVQIISDKLLRIGECQRLNSLVENAKELQNKMNRNSASKKFPEMHNVSVQNIDTEHVTERSRSSSTSSNRSNVSVSKVNNDLGDDVDKDMSDNRRSKLKSDSCKGLVTKSNYRKDQRRNTSQKGDESKDMQDEEVNLEKRHSSRRKTLDVLEDNESEIEGQALMHKNYSRNRSSPKKTSKSDNREDDKNKTREVNKSKLVQREEVISSEKDNSRSKKAPNLPENKERSNREFNLVDKHFFEEKDRALPIRKKLDFLESDKSENEEQVQNSRINRSRSKSRMNNNRNSELESDRVKKNDQRSTERCIDSTNTNSLKVSENKPSRKSKAENSIKEQKNYKKTDNSKNKSIARRLGENIRACQQVRAEVLQENNKSKLVQREEVISSKKENPRSKKASSVPENYGNESEEEELIHKNDSHNGAFPKRISNKTNKRQDDKNKKTQEINKSKLVQREELNSEKNNSRSKMALDVFESDESENEEHALMYRNFGHSRSSNVNKERNNEEFNLVDKHFSEEEVRPLGITKGLDFLESDKSENEEQVKNSRINRTRSKSLLNNNRNSALESDRVKKNDQRSTETCIDSTNRNTLKVSENKPSRKSKAENSIKEQKNDKKTDNSKNESIARRLGENMRACKEVRAKVLQENNKSKHVQRKKVISSKKDNSRSKKASSVSENYGNESEEEELIHKNDSHNGAFPKRISNKINKRQDDKNKKTQEINKSKLAQREEVNSEKNNSRSKMALDVLESGESENDEHALMCRNFGHSRTNNVNKERNNEEFSLVDKHFSEEEVWALGIRKELDILESDKRENEEQVKNCSTDRRRSKSLLNNNRNSELESDRVKKNDLRSTERCIDSTNRNSLKISKNKSIRKPKEENSIKRKKKSSKEVRAEVSENFSEHHSAVNVVQEDNVQNSKRSNLHSVIEALHKSSREQSIAVSESRARQRDGNVNRSAHSQNLHVSSLQHIELYAEDQENHHHDYRTEGDNNKSGKHQDVDRENNPLQGSVSEDETEPIKKKESRSKTLKPSSRTTKTKTRRQEKLNEHHERSVAGNSTKTTNAPAVPTRASTRQRTQRKMYQEIYYYVSEHEYLKAKRFDLKNTNKHSKDMQNEANKKLNYVEDEAVYPMMTLYSEAALTPKKKKNRFRKNKKNTESKEIKKPERTRKLSKSMKNTDRNDKDTNMEQTVDADHEERLEDVNHSVKSRTARKKRGRPRKLSKSMENVGRNDKSSKRQKSADADHEERLEDADHSAKASTVKKNKHRKISTSIGNKDKDDRNTSTRKTMGADYEEGLEGDTPEHAAFVDAFEEDLNERSTKDKSDNSNREELQRSTIDRPIMNGTEENLTTNCIEFPVGNRVQNIEVGKKLETISTWKEVDEGVKIAKVSSFGNVSFGIIKMESGIRKAKKILRKSHLFISILRGTGKFAIHGCTFIKKQGDVVTIPMGASYSLENTSERGDLDFSYVKVKIDI